MDDFYIQPENLSLHLAYKSHQKFEASATMMRSYDESSELAADEGRFSCKSFLDMRTFLSVILSFCRSPSTSANWRLS